MIEKTLLYAAGQAYEVPDDGGDVPQWIPKDSFGNAVGTAAGHVTWTRGPVGVAVGDNRDDAGLVGCIAGGVVIALRGTKLYFDPAKDAADWITDWINNLAIVLTADSGASPGEVSHGGFRLAAHAVANALEDDIRAALGAAGPAAPIFITGHSKGGAMAPFVARWLQRKGLAAGRAIKVRTFAAPRLCGGGFRDAYLASGIDHIRYEAYGDIVPLAPLAGPILEAAPAALLAKADAAMKAGYVDLGACRYITTSGAIVDEWAASSLRFVDLTYVAMPWGPTFLTQHAISKGSSYANASYP